MRKSRVEVWREYKSVRGVYCIAAVGSGAVKIGWSDKIGKRCHELQVSNPFGVHLLGIIRADERKLEKRIHYKLATYRLRGEWFAWVDAVREYVAVEFEQVSVSVTDPAIHEEVCTPYLGFEAIDNADEACVLVARLMKSLTPRGREILCMSYGIDRDDSLTAQDISSQLGLSKEYVNILRSASEERMRERAGTKLFAMPEYAVEQCIGNLPIRETCIIHSSSV